MDQQNVCPDNNDDPLPNQENNEAQSVYDEDQRSEYSDRSRTPPTRILPRPGNVNFCGIKIDKGYEPEVKEEEAFVTPVAHHQSYSTQKPKERCSKRLEDQAAERYRFILSRPEAPIVFPVNVIPLQPVPQAPVAPP
ncbi:14014_t:CDS:2, partial [Racocetra fulgida]